MRAGILVATAIFLSYAVPAFAQDYTGFWQPNCAGGGPHGMSIRPAPDKKYAISTCGTEGCSLLPPNTTIDGDPRFRVIDALTLEVQGDRREPWYRFRKCSADPTPKLEQPKEQPKQQAQVDPDERLPGRIRIKAYYQGLPDYEKDPVFKTDAAEPHRMLRAVLPKAAAPLCVRGRLEAKLNVDARELRTNLCDPSVHAKVKDLVRQIAPSLDPARLTLRTMDLDGDGEPELLVEYIDLPTPFFQWQEGGRVFDQLHPIPGAERRDPYLSLWHLKFDGSVYRATYAGHFLVGEVHAAAPFGQVGKPAMIFIRHQSCTECHASTYLTVVDFFRDDAFQFSYDESHQNFAHRIEYSLAGQGHTVEAVVETRVLPASAEGPHLMQRFLLEDYKVEWWVFRCVDLKCDYELHVGELPDQYRKAWAAARKL